MPDANAHFLHGECIRMKVNNHRSIINAETDRIETNISRRIIYEFSLRRAALQFRRIDVILCDYGGIA